MRAAATRRPAGRHAAPTPPRLVPGGAPGLLLGLVAAALGAAALVPTERPDGQHLTVVPLGSVTRPDLPAGDEPALARASRARRPPQTAPEPPPPPAAPPPAPVEVDVLPGCDASASAATRYANGRLPSSALCALPGRSGHKLRADAARAFVRLDAAYEERFGERICLTDSYRSYAAQAALRARKPRLAGRPGTSEHGFGRAVDLACGIDGFRTPQYRWMAENAGRFGWVQPSWARRGGAKPEPWHWEHEG